MIRLLTFTSLHYKPTSSRVFEDIRALFERSLSSLPANRAKPIWNKFLDYENQYGELSSIQRTEQRKSETYPTDNEGIPLLERLANRYGYLDLNVVGEQELGLTALKNLGKKTTSTSGPASSSGIKESRLLTESTSSLSLNKPNVDTSSTSIFTPIYPEKYPTPNLTNWIPLKSITSFSKPSTSKSTTPATTSIPRPSPSSATISPKISSVPYGVGALSSGQIYEPIARFIQKLPPAEVYIPVGPKIPVDELLDIIKKSPAILPPTIPPPLVPIPTPMYSTSLGGGGGSGSGMTGPLPTGLGGMTIPTFMTPSQSHSMNRSIFEDRREPVSGKPGVNMYGYEYYTERKGYGRGGDRGIKRKSGEEGKYTRFKFNNIYIYILWVFNTSLFYVFIYLFKFLFFIFRSSIWKTKDLRE